MGVPGISDPEQTVIRTRRWLIGTAIILVLGGTIAIAVLWNMLGLEGLVVGFAHATVFWFVPAAIYLACEILMSRGQVWSVMVAEWFAAFHAVVYVLLAPIAGFGVLLADLNNAVIAISIVLSILAITVAIMRLIFLLDDVRPLVANLKPTNRRGFEPVIPMVVEPVPFENGGCGNSPAK